MQRRAHLGRPRNWVTDAWAFVLAEEFGANPSPPAWFDLPQMSRNDTLSTPRLVRRFANWNAGKPTVDAVKPFNFLNRVFVDHRWLPNHLRGLVLAAAYTLVDFPGFIGVTHHELIRRDHDPLAMPIAPMRR